MISEDEFKRIKGKFEVFFYFAVLIGLALGRVLFEVFPGLYTVVLMAVFSLCFWLYFYPSLRIKRLMPFKRNILFKMEERFFYHFQIVSGPVSKNNRIYYCKEKDLYVGNIARLNNNRSVIVVYTPQKNVAFLKESIKNLTDAFQMQVKCCCSNDRGTLLILVRRKKSVYLALHHVGRKKYYQQQKLFYELIDRNQANG